MSNGDPPVRTLYVFSATTTQRRHAAQSSTQSRVTLAIIILAIVWAIASIAAAICVETRGADPSSTLARIFRRPGHAPPE